MHPGVTVRHVTAGPFEGLAKQDLPGQLCAFTAGVMRAEARHEPGWYDVIHSHYWLSGQVGWLARERWGVPLVHSAHTLAQGEERLARRRRRARSRGAGDRRGAGGRRGRPADRLDGRGSRAIWCGATAPTRRSCAPSPPASTSTASHPARLLRPAGGSASIRTALTLLFVGRIQPLKAPDLLLRAAALLRQRRGSGPPA